MENPLSRYLSVGNGSTSHSTASSSAPSSRAASPSFDLAASPDDPTPAKPTPTPLDLSAELPVILNDLIPLSFLVERVVGQVYVELATLAELLPAAPEPERKRKIVDYVLQTRRQILKLLVLVRWSSEAENVAKCMNIIGFLSRQNFEFDRATENLTEVKTMLAGARIRNYDLPTAITVLTTGTYTGLPSIFSENFAQPTTLSDEVVLKTLDELDDVLRWRLTCVEVLPRGMRRYWIADGRVTFQVEGLWEASFTYGGASDDDSAEWYLLSVKFLFRVKDARGVWSSVPMGPMKDHIVELCNRELAKRRPPEGGDGEAAGAEERDAPLVRGYEFLQQLVLSYQIEALYMQALELSATLWTGTLKVELAPDRKELTLDYWTPPTPPPAPKAGPSKTTSAAPLPAPGQPTRLTLSIRASPPPAPDPPKLLPPAAMATAAKAAIVASSSLEPIAVGARELALHRALARGHAHAEEDTEEDKVLERVRVGWTAEGLSDSVRAGVSLGLDADLDLEDLLVRTTSAHARESTLQLYHQLVGELDPDDVELVEPDPPPNSTGASSVPSIRVHLYGQHHVLASINPLSGRLEFREVGEVAAVRETRLRGGAEKVDKDRKSAGDTFLRLRASTIIDEVDSRAAFLGFRTVRQLRLRTHDYAKFGASSRSFPAFSFLFVHLPKLPNNYLVLVLAEEGFRFALVSVREVTEALQTYLTIEELGWLDKSPSNGDWEPSSVQPPPLTGHDKPAPFGFDVTVEDLRDLYQYCVRRIAFFKIEQQLHIRRIPYKSVATYSPSSSPDSPTPPSPTFPDPAARPKLLSTTSPYLVIQSSDLLRSTARVAYPNIAIQCFLKDDVIWTTLHVRFRDLALANPDPAELPSSMTYDPATSVITFTSDDIDTCVPTFLTAYSLIARSIVLARHKNGAGVQITPDDDDAMAGVA